MTGTPGFYGERLREAREARGLTVNQLVELIGVTKQAVSLWERLKSGPTPDTFERIAKALRLPKQYFLRPPTTPLGGTVFYRSMASATKRMRERAERRLNWFRQICDYVAEHVDLPAVDLPELGYSPNPEQIDAAQIEEAATAVRRHWGLGDRPISNVAMLMEGKGVLVSRFELEADKLDAFSVWESASDRPYVVLAADKASAVRSRFDAAHELAPFMNECIIPNIHSLKEPKLKWKASIGLLIMRAEELGIFSPEQTDRLWRHRARLGWKTREPYDDVLEPELPVLIAKSLRLLMESGTASPEEIVYSTALEADDIEVLTSLPSGSMRPRTEDSNDPEPQLLKFPGPNRARD